MKISGYFKKNYNGGWVRGLLLFIFIIADVGNLLEKITDPIQCLL